MNSKEKEIEILWVSDQVVSVLCPFCKTQIIIEENRPEKCACGHKFRAKIDVQVMEEK